MLRRLAVVCNSCNSVVWYGVCACGLLGVKSNNSVLTIFSDYEIDTPEGFTLSTVWEDKGKVIEIMRLPSISTIHSAMDKDVLNKLHK